MASKRKRSTQSTKSIEHGRRPRRARRAPRRLALFVLLLTVTVVAVPTMVAKSSLRNTLLGMTMPDGGWRIESQQASLAWLGGQSLRGVSIVDPDGKLLLTVESITLDRSLLALAANRNDLGKVQLVRPVGYLATRSDGSNVEDLLAAIGNKESPRDETANQSPPVLPAIQVEIVDGAVRGFDTELRQEWTLNQANLVAMMGEAAAGGLDINGAIRLSQGKGEPTDETKESTGRLKFRLKQTAEGQQQLDLLAEQLPLEPLRPWLARILTGCRVSGTMSTDSQVRWALDPQQGLVMQTTGRFEASQLDITADLLQGDRLQCDQLTAPWKLSVAGGLLTAEQLSLDAGWARLQASGSMTLDELTSLSTAKLPQRETTISGNVNLARLATMLPYTLQLRSGVRIDSGQMKFQADGKPRGGVFAWRVTVAVENVVGTDGGRPIRWQQPIEATLEFAQTQQGPRMEQLSFSAPFAQAQFKTTQDQIDGQFQLDLGRLSQELGQFVDLGTWQFRGQGEGKLVLGLKADEKFQAQAKLNLRDLNVAQEGQLIWTEPQLEIQLRATGQAVDFSPRQIASGSIQLRGARDSFNLELLEPVDFQSADQPWMLRIDGKGPLESWAGRLRPWLASVPKEVGGEAHLEAKVQIASDFVHLMESRMNVEQLRVRQGSLALDEPRLEFSGDCRWDAKTGGIATRELQLVSSSLAFRSRDVKLDFASAGAPTATGSVAFRADLQRLASTAGLIGGQESIWPRGTAVGQLKLTSDAQRLQADFSIQTEQLQLLKTPPGSEAVYGRPDVLWTEPQLQATGQATYVISQDRGELKNLQLTGQTIRLNTTASLDKLQTDARLQASGTVEYDSAALAKLLTTYLGPEVRIQGNRQIRFQVAGRLSDPAPTDAPVHWSRRWQATADTGWSAASVFGLTLGASNLQATLGDGQLQLAPVEVAMGGGRLTASPRAVLAPGPEQLILPKGPFLTKVQISPQVSETMLKYIAPILAGATRTEGQFSVDLEGVQIPLADPRQAQIAGRLSVHSLRVTPGPMVAELATVVKQIEALAKRKQFFQAATSTVGTKALTIEDRQIEFQVVQGRVYHRNLEFLVDGVPVRSRGSVGLDQTLALVIEIPIQDKWIEREKALRSLAGQSLQIPIGGTFQKPRIDQRAVADLSRQMLEGAASQAIGSEINRQLDKLFKSR